MFPKYDFYMKIATDKDRGRDNSPIQLYFLRIKDEYIISLDLTPPQPGIIVVVKKF